MRRAGPARWLCVAIAACTAACGQGGTSHAPSAPAPSVGGGGGGPTVLPHRDGAPSGADDDGGAIDASMLVDAGSFEVWATECDNVTASDPMDVAPDGKLTNALSAPMDLAVTRVEATWDGNCVAPAIRVTLSDGRCPVGKGHEVEFLFDARAIADGKLGRGLQPLEPEPGNLPIRVRYRRPAALDPVTAGEWGTCLGVVGTVDFPIAPGASARDELRGRFLMELAPCDDMALLTRSVNGNFDVTLRRGLDDVCPPAK